MQLKLFFIVLILKYIYFWLFFKQYPLHLYAAVALFQMLYASKTVSHRAVWMDGRCSLSDSSGRTGAVRISLD